MEKYPTINPTTYYYEVFIIIAEIILLVHTRSTCQVVIG